jgi:ankyrin repeat protein
MRRLPSARGPVVVLVIGVAIIAIRWRAEPDDREARRSAALFDASRAGNLAEMERAIAGGMAVDSIESGSRMTPLCWAVKGNHPAVVDWLLARGANLEVVTGYGPPLGIAAGREDSTVMVRFLLDRGADPNGCSIDGHTPLMTAAGRGDVATVELLIRAGAQVNARDRWGNTAVSTAQADGHAEIVGQLIAAAAQHLSPCEPATP